MVLDLFKSRRRAHLRGRAAPKAWREILERNLPVFHRLTPEDQTELLGHTQVFLAEKRFEGCGGLVLTDEIRDLLKEIKAFKDKMGDNSKLFVEYAREFNDIHEISSAVEAAFNARR